MTRTGLFVLVVETSKSPPVPELVVAKRLTFALIGLGRGRCQRALVWMRCRGGLPVGGVQPCLGRLAGVVIKETDNGSDRAIGGLQY